MPIGLGAVILAKEIMLLSLKKTGFANFSSGYTRIRFFIQNRPRILLTMPFIDTFIIYIGSFV